MKYKLITSYCNDDLLSSAKDVRCRHTLVETWSNLTFDELKQAIIDVTDTMLNDGNEPYCPSYDDVQRVFESYADKCFIEEMHVHAVNSYKIYEYLLNETIRKSEMLKNNADSDCEIVRTYDENMHTDFAVEISK